MFEVFFYGPLRVILEDDSGRVVSVQDRISGMDASFRFSPDYIAMAREKALIAFHSLADYA